ncbi:MAG: hypothetical protein AAGC77_00860 [Pseudomonadota bacterium]
MNRIAIAALSTLGAIGAMGALGSAAAQEISEASDTTRFLLDSALFVAAGLGAVLMIFALGLRDIALGWEESGRAICLRTIGLIAVAVIAYWVCGHQLTFDIEAAGLLGDFAVWRANDIDPLSEGVSSGAVFFFYAMCAGLIAALVSSAVSERVKLWSFLVFVGALTAVIFPIIGSWVWGGGYLSAVWRFTDLGGAAVIHISAGAAALGAAIVVGPRPGRFARGHRAGLASPALPLAGIATGLVLIGQVFLLAGLHGSYSTIDSAITLGAMMPRYWLAVAGGVGAALIVTRFVFHEIDLYTILSAAMAGAVAIAADPVNPALWQAVMIGAGGGVIATVAPPFLERYKIDDAAGVAPTHFFAGAWGALIVPWTNAESSFLGQLVGVAAISSFALVTSTLAWLSLKYTIGARERMATETRYAAS